VRIVWPRALHGRTRLDTFGVRVRALVAGLNSRLFNFFGIGDYNEIGNIAAACRRSILSTAILRVLEDARDIVPNGKIVSEINYTFCARCAHPRISQARLAWFIARGRANGWIVRKIAPFR